MTHGWNRNGDFVRVENRCTYRVREWLDNIQNNLSARIVDRKLEDFTRELYGWIAHILNMPLQLKVSNEAIIIAAYSSVRWFCTF